MFSHIVTAARGLFVAPERTNNDDSGPDSSEEKSSPKMVTATRQTVFSPDGTSVPKDSPKTNGKRKDTPSTAGSVSTRPVKRRKAASLSASRSGTSTPVSSEKASKRLQVLDSVEIISNSQATDSTPSTPAPESIAMKPSKTPHLRFGSEEPPSHINEPSAEEVKEDQKTPQEIQNEAAESAEESSDDEAPEAVSNVAQLARLKDAERKKEQLKLKVDQQKKEKRREHGKRLQSQASSKPLPERPAQKRKETQSLTQDEILSESSATLQGSEIKDLKFDASKPLPALLPDDILNAEPTEPSQMPLAEIQPAKGKTSNLRRLVDTVDKPPKDLKMGLTSVRVLGSGHTSSGNKPNTTLPPKASKSSRRVREGWMAGNRNGGGPSSLRRTTGAPTSFVRN